MARTMTNDDVWSIRRAQSCGSPIRVDSNDERGVVGEDGKVIQAETLSALQLGVEKGVREMRAKNCPQGRGGDVEEGGRDGDEEAIERRLGDLRDAMAAFTGETEEFLHTTDLMKKVVGKSGSVCTGIRRKGVL